MKKLLGISAVLVAFILTAGAQTATAETPDNNDQPIPSDSKVLSIPDALLPEQSLPIPDVAIAQFASDTQLALSEQDQFSGVYLNDDRKGVTVYWYGESNAELQSAAGAVPAGYSFGVKETKFLPIDLKDAIDKLMENPSVIEGAEISVASAPIDASRIDLEVKVADGAKIDAAALEASYEEVVGSSKFPVVVTASPGLDTSAGRNDSAYNIAGMTIHDGTGIACTTNFAVTAQSNPAVKGIMTAAHCGAVGQNWYKLRTSLPVVGLYAFGNETARYTSRDAALVTNATYYDPYIYWGTYTSSTYVGITGVLLPVANASLCFSGSYSGTVCSNVVSTLVATCNLGGDLSAVNCVVSTQSVGIPAAGHGDSGGPGVQIVAYNGANYLSASTIISAIPGGSGSTCQGIPGGTGTNDRKCSSTVYSTQAYWAAQGLFQDIVTLPYP